MHFGICVEDQITEIKHWTTSAWGRVMVLIFENITFMMIQPKSITKINVNNRNEH